MALATHRSASLASSAAALLVLASLASAGCTTIGRRVGVPIPEPTAHLEEGVTRVSDVVDRFGPPARMSELPDGLAMLYEYIDARENQLGINLELIGLDWFKLAFGRGAADRQALLLVFDQDGTLRAREYKAWHENIGRGFGFQIFFVAMPTVDSKHLWESPEQFTWGKQSLEPLMTVLNLGNGVTNGAHGIEMRGTPDSVGQRTLEAQRKRRRR